MSFATEKYIPNGIYSIINAEHNVAVAYSADAVATSSSAGLNPQASEHAVPSKFDLDLNACNPVDNYTDLCEVNLVY